MTNKIAPNTSISNFQLFKSQTHSTKINKPTLISRPTTTKIKTPTLPYINNNNHHHHHHHHRRLYKKKTNYTSSTISYTNEKNNNKLVNNFHQHEIDVTSNTLTPYKRQHGYYKNSFRNKSKVIQSNTYLPTTLLTKPQNKIIPFPSYLQKQSRYYLPKIIPYLLQEIIIYTNHTNYPTQHKIMTTTISEQNTINTKLDTIIPNLKTHFTDKNVFPNQPFPLRNTIDHITPVPTIL